VQNSRTSFEKHSKRMKKIAIIGSGISGLSAAYFLKEDFDITIFEKLSRIGGNSRTIEISKDSFNTKVDTGFIVLNDRNYPLLTKLFEDLKIELHDTEMSFSVSSSKYEWSGNNLDSLFAQRKNLLDIKMIKGVLDILKFNKKAVEFVDKNPTLSIDELINSMNLGIWFKENYLYPMGSSIWSSNTEEIAKFPAKSFVSFFNNHGLLTINNRPEWMSLKNKSIDYVSKLENLLQEKVKIIKNANIQSINRDKNKIKIRNEDQDYEFDKVIFSNHPEEILKNLKDPSQLEEKILRKFKQSKNIAYTHNDERMMPHLKKCWASWNFKYDNNLEQGSVTYWMNKLQNIDYNFPIFVTLNPIIPIKDSKIYDIYEFYHPQYNMDSLLGQKEIRKIQGKNNLYFCGAYIKNGFHEDGISSAKEVADAIKNETIKGSNLS
jgi:predicted NAD/FAD-binding protein